MENEKLFNRRITTTKKVEESFFFFSFSFLILYIFIELIYTMNMYPLLPKTIEWFSTFQKYKLSILFYQELKNSQQGHYRKLLKIVLQNWLNFKFILPGIGKTVWFAFFFCFKLQKWVKFYYPFIQQHKLRFAWIEFPFSI